MTIRELYAWAVANNAEDFQLGELFSDGVEVFEVGDFTVHPENNFVSLNN